MEANETITKLMASVWAQMDAKAKRASELLAASMLGKTIQYWEDHGDGGFWKDVTPEFALKCMEDKWDVSELRIKEEA